MISVKTIPKRHIKIQKANTITNPQTFNRKNSNQFLKKIDNSCKETDNSSESDFVKRASLATKEASKIGAKRQCEKDKQVFQLEKEIRQNSTFKFNENNIQSHKISIVIQKFHQLLQLYIQEQIIKHYCMKTEWQFEKKLVESHVLPTLDLLSIRREDVKFRFQPFLEKLTDKYLLKTELDTFSRLPSSTLLIQITYAWLKIKQAEISLKREIRANIEDFKKIFCHGSSFQIDKKKVNNVLFENSKDLRIVNVIKLYMFLFRIQNKQNSYGIDVWIKEYWTF